MLHIKRRFTAAATNEEDVAANFLASACAEPQQDDPGAQPRNRGPSGDEDCQVQNGNGGSAILQHSGQGGARRAEVLESDEGKHLHHPVARDRVPLGIALAEQKQHAPVE